MGCDGFFPSQTFQWSVDRRRSAAGYGPGWGRSRKAWNPLLPMNTFSHMSFFSWLAIFSNLSYPLFGLGQRLQLATPHKQIKLAAAPTSSVASCSREPSGPIHCVRQPAPAPAKQYFSLTPLQPLVLASPTIFFSHHSSSSLPNTVIVSQRPLIFYFCLFLSK